MNLQISEGTPVLISIEGFGPMFARSFVEETEPMYLDPEGPFDVAVPGMRSWRVEVPEIPQHLVQLLRPVLERMGAPAEVRLWGAIERECYVGKAYGLFNAFQPYSGTRPTIIGMTLHGQGRIDRERAL